MLKRLKRFASHTAGNVALSMALMAVPLLGGASVAVDYTVLYNKKSSLQNAADSAALSSAKELVIASTDVEEIKALSKEYIYANLSYADRLTKDVVIDTVVSDDRSEITVNLAYYWKPFLAHHFDGQVLPIRAKATAGVTGGENICVIALDKAATSSFSIAGKSTVTANDCAIFSNSISPTSYDVDTKGSIAGSNLYSAGGYRGSLTSFSPVPITDTPVIGDPLVNRIEPAVGNCETDKTALNFEDQVVTLKPGTYCGGIMVSGGTVMLEPGVYVIKDGMLNVIGKSTFKGENVGFYFSGNQSTVEFGSDSVISLTAPKTGLMAGLLMFEERSSAMHRKFSIRSKNAERMEGAIYLPNGTLFIDKSSRVGQISKWTAIVANRVELKDGPKLEINTDYTGSDIPVPEGIGPKKGTTRLIR